MTRWTPTLLLLPLAACGSDPMRYIPAGDRAVLQAEARLGAAQAQPEGRLSVAEMLARARGSDGAEGALTLRFAGAEVQPDAAMRARLAGFAAANRGRAVVVTGGRGDPALLGERRAVAVARALEAEFPGVELRFADAPPDAVQIATGPGTGLAVRGGP